MYKLSCLLKFSFIIIVISIFLNGCVAGLLLEDAAALAIDFEEVGIGRALVASTEGILIADETLLSAALDKVFIEGDELYTRVEGTPKRSFARVTGRNTIYMNKYGEVQVPGEIYRVRGDGVRVRSSLANEYIILQRRSTGQIVLKLYEQNGWARVELGNHVYGWMSLAYLVIANDSSYSNKYIYQKCNQCDGMGHAIQNVNCSLCHGIGKIDCGYCLGMGSSNCLTCNATGRIVCVHCNGKGNISCDQCFGLGYTSDSFGNHTICSNCKGNKTIQCLDCNGVGSSLCYDCNGKKTIQCTYCQGSKKQICPQCFKDGYTSQDIYCCKCKGSGWIAIINTNNRNKPHN